MWSKIAQILSLSLILCGTAQADDTDTSAPATNGQFTILDLNQRAPFRGTLFDPAATAHILTLQPRLRAEFQLELNYKLSELGAQHRLEIDTLNSRYTALDDEYRLRLEAKDNEIYQLNESLSKLSRNDRHWFLIGGIGIGVGVTTAIVMAVSNASN